MQNGKVKKKKEYSMIILLFDECFSQGVTSTL